MQLRWPKFGSTRKQQERSAVVPEKVFITKDGNNLEWSESAPNEIKLRSLLDGFYAQQNFIELFHCLPEIFAPINEIASRVADATWELCGVRSDDVDYNNKTFNRLFSQPNPLFTIRQMIYNSVCYEYLTGRILWYLNRPDTLPQDDPNSILSWFVLPSHRVIPVLNKEVDPYSTTRIEDFIQTYKIPQGKDFRFFDPKNVIPHLHLSLSEGYDITKPKPPILGAEKAIRNLVPVYEARGAIYIKVGALGAWVNRARDASGTVPMTEEEKKSIAELEEKTYGVTGNKSPIKYTTANVDFVRTAMSIKELAPFEETLSDAVAIYAALRVPRHLVPSKDSSTFNNAAADMRSFYSDVIIPKAKVYADLFTSWFKFPNRFIRPNFSHVDALQENKKEKADVDKVNAETASMMYEKNMITKNERNAMLGLEAVADGDKYANDTLNPDPLAIRLGVNGVSALQSILSNSSMADEAKKSALVILFGISEEDAAKLVVPKPEEPNPNPIGGGFRSFRRREWDESEHPRDELGRWTFKNGSSASHKDAYPNIEFSVYKSMWSEKEDGILSDEKLKEFMDATGLPPNISGECTIRSFRDGEEVQVDFSGEGVKMVRFFMEKDGLIVNEMFEIESDSKWKGSGAAIFNSQVQSAAEQGYKTIEVQAALGRRSNGEIFMNGYYTWARLGYEPQRPSDLAGKVDDYNYDTKSDAKSLREIMGTKTGQQWWKENGIGWVGAFDLSKGSDSRKTLENYMKEKKSRNKRGQSTAQQELDDYRETGIEYYNPDDEKFMDFSKLGK